MTALTKRDVEQLLADYDADPVGALTVALRSTLDRPDLEFTALVKLAGFSCDRRIRLQAQDVSAMDELLAELNELRTVNDDRRGHTPAYLPAGAPDSAPPTGTPPR